MDWRAGIGDAAFLLQRLDFLWRVGAVRVYPGGPERAFDGHLRIAELGIVEDVRLLGLLEGEEGLNDAFDIALGQFAALLAEIFTQRY